MPNDNKWLTTFQLSPNAKSRQYSVDLGFWTWLPSLFTFSANYMQLSKSSITSSVQPRRILNKIALWRSWNPLGTISTFYLQFFRVAHWWLHLGFSSALYQLSASNRSMISVTILLQGWEINRLITGMNRMNFNRLFLYAFCMVAPMSLHLKMVALGVWAAICLEAMKVPRFSFYKNLLWRVRIILISFEWLPNWRLI